MSLKEVDDVPILSATGWELPTLGLKFRVSLGRIVANERAST